MAKNLYILILVLSNLFTQLALWTRVRKYVKFVKTVVTATWTLREIYHNTLLISLSHQDQI